MSTSSKSIRVCAALAIIAVIGWRLIRDTDLYLQFFGLDGRNTVYDFYTARTPVAVYWTMHMCKDGHCLTSRDWDCGYDNGDKSAVDECFYRRAGEVPVWWRLDRLRVECGHSTMVFTGAIRDVKRCANLGEPRFPTM